MCWAFDVCEGDLRGLYWRYSFREIQQRLQLKFGEVSTLQLCQYNSLAQIVSQALGGSEASTDNATSIATDGKSLESAVAEINGLLRF